MFKNLHIFSYWSLGATGHWSEKYIPLRFILKQMAPKIILACVREIKGSEGENMEEIPVFLISPFIYTHILDYVH